MPKLRPPRGRQAAAATPELENETDLQGALDSLGGQKDGGAPDRSANESASDDGSVLGGDRDDAASLKAEIAALQRANKEYVERIEAERLEKAEALRQVQERRGEIDRLLEQTTNSQADAINAALAAAEAEAEAAQRDIEAAASLGDTKAQSEAYRKLSRAEAKILRLEDGKEALEREKTRRAETSVQQQSDDPLEKINLPPLAKNWLRKHPEFMHDPRKNSKIQVLHYDVVDEGYAPYSPEYFEVLEQKLGMRTPPVSRTQEPEEEDDVDDTQSNRRTIVSAPPSRETPSSSGTRGTDQVRLSAAEKEAARISGISEKDYALNKLKLMKEKANGNYGGQP